MNFSLRALEDAAPSSLRPSQKQLRSGLALGLGSGALAALVCVSGARDWYGMLVKPQWALSIAALALLQLLVFILAGAALAYLQTSRAPFERRRIVMRWFWAQGALGLLWNLCFWNLHSAGLGYTVILLWWCAVVALLWTGSRLSRAAFLLLVPLWAWVTFASSLNFAVLSFNVLRQTSAEMDADPRNANSPADPPIIVRKK